MARDMFEGNGTDGQDDQGEIEAMFAQMREMDGEDDGLPPHTGLRLWDVMDNPLVQETLASLKEQGAKPVALKDIVRIIPLVSAENMDALDLVIASALIAKFAQDP